MKNKHVSLYHYAGIGVICFLCIIVIGWITGSGPSMALCVTVGLAIGISSSWETN
jgi:hypothetical protein